MQDYSEIVELLKLDIGISSTARDYYFLSLVKSSTQELNSRGACLDFGKTEDVMLAADYAAWKYRHRETGEGMPENIRQRLINRRTEKRSNG